MDPVRDRFADSLRGFFYKEVLSSGFAYDKIIVIQPV